MLAILLNNTIYCFTDNYDAAYMIDFFTGNSILANIFLIMISVRFNYCIWHRIIICGNIANSTIAMTDAIFTIPISDMKLLLSYYIVAAIFVLLAAYTHIKHVHHERKINNIKEYASKSN